MDPTTSTHFVSAIATGETWRDTAKNILEQLEAVKTDGFEPTIGFMYLTDALVPDAESILNLFRTVTGIQNWSGCGAVGVCGNGIEYIDVPAISVLVGHIPEDKFRAFSMTSEATKIHTDLEPWLNTHDPMLVFVHGDPHTHIAGILEDIDTAVGGFMVGGLSSDHLGLSVISDDHTGGGISGYIFADDVMVATTLSQGCVPIGPAHEISKGDDHVIAYLDGEPPVEVFTRDITAHSLSKQLSHGAMVDEDFRAELSDIPIPSGNMKGIAHVAFPIPESDKGDYLVRNIVAIDPTNGMMAVSERIEDGQKVMFVHRDDKTVRDDLTHTMIELHKRVMASHGVFKPKAALYVSCVARAGMMFGEAGMGGEMALIRDILGDIPLAGFYAGGEISNTRIYGYTGILTLFL
jgi:small ligand-binding sensory domain FIST